MVYGSVAPDYVPMCRRGADYGSLPAPASRAKASVCFPCCYETRYSTPAGQGANTEICRMAWQVFDEEIHHDRCSFVIFLTVTIPAAFRGSDWNSLPGALHTHATPHEWLAPPLLCYKKKKKKRMTHIFPLQQEYMTWHLFSQQLCNQRRVLKSYCSVALLELEWYNSFSLDYYTK